MAEFMGQMIIDGKYTYAYVINKKPTLKDGIDAYLISKGKQNLITQ